MKYRQITCLGNLKIWIFIHSHSNAEKLMVLDLTKVAQMGWVKCKRSWWIPALADISLFASKVYPSCNT